jgi:hypothetical protein
MLAIYTSFFLVKLPKYLKRLNHLYYHYHHHHYLLLSHSPIYTSVYAIKDFTAQKESLHLHLLFPSLHQHSDPTHLTNALINTTYPYLSHYFDPSQRRQNLDRIDKSILPCLTHTHTHTQSFKGSSEGRRKHGRKPPTSLRPAPAPPPPPHFLFQFFFYYPLP